MQNTMRYTDVSTCFTGMGSVLIHAPSLKLFIESKFMLNDSMLPLQSYKHALYYYLSNLTNHFDIKFFDLVSDLKNWKDVNDQAVKLFSETDVCDFINGFDIDKAERRMRSANHASELLDSSLCCDKNAKKELIPEAYENIYSYTTYMYMKELIQTLPNHFYTFNEDTLRQYQYNERVSLVFVSNNFVDIKSFFLKNGIYTATFYGIEFRMPDVYAFVNEPFFKVKFDNENKDKFDCFDYAAGNHSFDENCSKLKRNLRKCLRNIEKFLKNASNREDEKLNLNVEPSNLIVDDEYLKSKLINDLKCVEVIDNIVDPIECLNILYKIYSDFEFIKNYDGRTFKVRKKSINNGDLANNTDDAKDYFEYINTSINNNLTDTATGISKALTHQIEPFIPLTNNASINDEIALSFTRVVEGKEKKKKKKEVSAVCAVRTAADSMYNGQLAVASLKPTECNIKISSKQQQIIDENKKRLREKDAAVEREFMKNFYMRFTNASTKNKSKILEFSLSSYSNEIKINVMCLRIEYYFNIWSLERRKDDPDFNKLIPCYIACLETVDIIIEDALKKYEEESRHKELLKEMSLSKGKKSGKPGKNGKKGKNAENNDNSKNSSKSTNKRKSNTDECMNEADEKNDQDKDIEKDKYEVFKTAENPLKETPFLRQMTFALNKLTEMNFVNTIAELKEKYNIPVELECEGVAKPSDFELYIQLKYAGDKLKRTLNSKKDPRVVFTPDGWQVNLLNLVDRGSSAVVCAPTSSGKTFICFYAIEKVLRQSDNDIVIFCLPTKALLNQVRADIYARFSNKSYKSSKVLQGVCMKDFDVDPFTCQVLVTVPSMLETILKVLHKKNITNRHPGKQSLESKDAKKNVLRKNKKIQDEEDLIHAELMKDPRWSEQPFDIKLSDIKYIIIDEVHKIGSLEMGASIERVVHLSPCPMLVLSATLGNLEGFFKWMKLIEHKKGRKCELVVHKERYCELKPYVFHYKEEKIKVVNKALRKSMLRNQEILEEQRRRAEEENALIIGRTNEDEEEDSTSDNSHSSDDNGELESNTNNKEDISDNNIESINTQNTNTPSKVIEPEFITTYVPELTPINPYLLFLTIK
ncbi:hypothetical protein EDEG_02540 [Edhazardia aedis USNM 41457]|uniref:Helicase ATP-binding domain-containing protein n=1 Tax=Edhazardia aedis (strain USNM 41457) TaxID=1003232 RepID=J9D5M8_EDHAE|nr:hypothetical protein EDEG_02540 [Edhazardia aedis USNM 41457]|eukprot:EJW03061.1 hypothetical protein EDEG_02540 [Edhazardia aedis USNM 41457]